MPLVEIYTKTFCGFCWRAKHLLESKGVQFKEISVDFGGEARQQMIERANGRTTVPQIFIAGRHGPSEPTGSSVPRPSLIHRSMGRC